MRNSVWAQWLKRRSNINAKKERNRSEKRRWDSGGGDSDSTYATSATGVTRAASTGGSSDNVSRGNHTHQERFPEDVLALPAIPTDHMLEVIWVGSGGGGSGDDQVWRAIPGQSFFAPTQLLSSLSGTP